MPGPRPARRPSGQTLAGCPTCIPSTSQHPVKYPDQCADPGYVAAAEIPRRLLGELLVEAGVLSGDQLEQALAEQEKSGRLLGEIILGLGFASRHEIASALAEQSGYVLEREPGFGSGLLTEIRRRREAAALSEGDRLRPSDLESGPSAASPSIMYSGKARPHTSSSPEAEPPRALARGYQLLRLELEPDEEPGAVTESEAADETSTESAGERSAEPAGGYAGASMSATAGVVPLIEVPTDPRSQLEQAAQGHEGPSAKALEQGSGEASPGHCHLTFAALGGRYELVERRGAPPGVGEQVSDGETGQRFLVSKIARSPLPLDSRLCAYLQPLD